MQINGKSKERGEIGIRSAFGPARSSRIRNQRLMHALGLIFLSADEDVTLAGFKEKFKTYVIVDSNGVNMWMSPASFKSSCDMVIRFYPFDRQTCHLTFGSLTFDNRLLKMMNKDNTHSTSGWTEKKLVFILMYR